MQTVEPALSKTEKPLRIWLVKMIRMITWVNWSAHSFTTVVFMILSTWGNFHLGNVLASAQKTTKVILSGMTSYGNFAKKCFILYSCSGKLNPYETYDFREFLIPNAFEHVRWQNTFNRFKLHQISPPMVDSSWILVKFINYQNVTRLCNVYALGTWITYYGPRASPTDGCISEPVQNHPWFPCTTSLSY